MNYNPEKDQSGSGTTVPRISKLKRRKRRKSPNPLSQHDLNPLAQFAASNINSASAGTGTRHSNASSSAPVNSGGSGSGSGSGSRSGSVGGNGGRKQRVIRSTAEILNLKNEKYSPSIISAQIDYFITSTLQSESTPAISSSEEIVQHSIFGGIYVGNRDANKTHDWCKLSFPPLQIGGTKTECHMNRRNGKKHRHGDIHNLFRRGDGIVLTDDALHFPICVPKPLSILSIPTPVLKHQMANANDTQGIESYDEVKWIKIISKHGATIRRNFEINSSSSKLSAPASNDPSEFIGKLSFGSVRMCTGSKWLIPPVRDSKSHDYYNNYVDSDSDDTEYENDNKLVPVIRYRLILLQCDFWDGDSSVTDNFNDADCNFYKRSDTSKRINERECLEGWISDRSRLQDDPYLIAEILNE